MQVELSAEQWEAINQMVDHCCTVKEVRDWLESNKPPEPAVTLGKRGTEPDELTVLLLPSGTRRLFLNGHNVTPGIVDSLERRVFSWLADLLEERRPRVRQEGDELPRFVLWNDGGLWVGIAGSSVPVGDKWLPQPPYRSGSLHRAELNTNTGETSND